MLIYLVLCRIVYSMTLIVLVGPKTANNEISLSFLYSKILALLMPDIVILK